MTKTTYTPKKQQLNLEDYPHAIAQARAAIARCDQRIAVLEASIEQRNAQFEKWVADNADLRNDTQRRAALKEHRYNDAQYQGWLALLQNQRDKRTQQEIKLELLRSSFSVAKLQLRQQIADSVAGSDGLALVA
jgi:multidrug resistance efflux pump